MRRFPILLLVAAAAACDQVPGPVAPEGPGGAAFATLSTVSQQATPAQADVAAAVPGFGGYYIDSTGRPTVWLTDPAQRPAAEAALAGFLASFGWTAADLQVRQADYSFAQLDAWYTAAWPRALAVPGAVFTDLDEGSNRLRFGGVDVAALSNIASTLANLGVPSAATMVEVAAPIERLALLTDKVRPPHGGLQIQFFALPASPLVSVCTLGFNAIDGGVQSFITNSHCTNIQGGIDGVRTDYYQSTRGGVIPNPDNFVAFEVEDPAYTAGLPDCPAGFRCRYSDASRAQYAAGQVFSIGRIAQAAQLNTQQLSDDPGMLTIDAVTPYRKITAEQALPIQGQTLNKTGRTSGWTQGVVVGTCVNTTVLGSDIGQLCQARVEGYSDSGDSGSPVYGHHTDGTLFLAGILWGGSVTGTPSWVFSPMQNIESEIGALETLAPVDPITGGKKPKKVR
jgi:hypothetical protein